MKICSTQSVIGEIPIEKRKIILPIFWKVINILAFPGGSDGKASAYNVGDLGSIPGSGRSPGEGNHNPLQYSCLENPMDRETWLGYSPWGRKESDTTERLHSSLTHSLT